MSLQETAINADEQFYGPCYSGFCEAQKDFEAMLEKLKDAYASAGKRFPIEHHKTRIKSAASAKEKLSRLNLAQTAENAVNHLFDIVGVRLVCQFIADVYEVERILLQTEGLAATQVKDYIKNPKTNGYRSIHIIMRMAPKSEEITVPHVEAQIRTIAMDFWSSLEHELKYKKNVPDSELMFDELKRCADEIASVDLSMQAIYEWIRGC